MTLKEFICDPKTQQPMRGACVRVAEYLGVVPNTVRNWSTGFWKPSREMSIQIKKMIAAEISLSPRKNTGRPKK
jgi:uncharacterized protein YjcR